MADTPSAAAATCTNAPSLDAEDGGQAADAAVPDALRDDVEHGRARDHDQRGSCEREELECGQRRHRRSLELPPPGREVAPRVLHHEGLTRTVRVCPHRAADIGGAGLNPGCAAGLYFKPDGRLSLAPTSR